MNIKLKEPQSLLAMLRPCLSITLLLCVIFTSTIAAAAAPQLTKKTISQNQADQHISIEVNYPQITGNPLNQASNDFNQLIQSWAEQDVSAFTQAHQQRNPNIPKSIPSKLQTNYQITLNQLPELVSIRFNTTRFVAGQAHPAHLFNVVNYDLKNNKSLRLADIFKPNTEYLKVIATYSIQQLKRQYPQYNTPETVHWVMENARAVPENYQYWNLTLSGLLITFAEGQVTRYVDNPAEVTIPYSTLAPLMQQRFILKPNHSTKATMP